MLHSVPWGAALLGLGVAVMAVAMASLWIYGGGLPMNAFPPPRFVDRNIYCLVPHPIYGGFVLACAGAAILTGSATGLWLITPAVALACGALVLGYELPDLRKRLGGLLSSPWLPRDRPEPPSLVERLRIYFVILLPWLTIFELLGALGKPPDWVSSYLPFEMRLPVIEQTELLYAGTYVVVLLVPLLARSGSALRRFAQQGLIAMALIFPLYLFLPFFVPPSLLSRHGRRTSAAVGANAQLRYRRIPVLSRRLGDDRSLGAGRRQPLEEVSLGHVGASCRPQLRHHWNAFHRGCPRRNPDLPCYRPHE